MVRFLLAVAIAALALVSPVQVSAQGISQELDIDYGAHPRQRMDIYTPAVINDDTPILVLFHGGGWQRGDKSGLRRAGESLAVSGVIVVAANYRLYPDASFPDFLHDAAEAVAFASDRLRTQNGDRRILFLGGWSAGAYNAAMITIDQRYLADVGIAPGTVAGIVGLAGPYEGGLCAGARCPHVFPDALRADWPVDSFVDSDDPPMLLIHGARDEYVDQRHLDGLAEAARAAGIEVTTLIVPNAFHRTVLQALEDTESAIRQVMAEFIDAHVAR